MRGRMRMHCFLSVLLVGVLGARATENAYQAQVSVFFSPRGGATAAVIQELQAAKRDIRVQAYSFTSAPIALIHTIRY